MDVLTTILELLAAAAVVYGVYLIFMPAAFIVGGLLVFAISYGITQAVHPKPAGDDG